MKGFSDNLNYFKRAAQRLQMDVFVEMFSSTEEKNT